MRMKISKIWEKTENESQDVKDIVLASLNEHGLPSTEQAS